jgi:hypothetical protein
MTPGDRPAFPCGARLDASFGESSPDRGIVRGTARRRFDGFGRPPYEGDHDVTGARGPASGTMQ